MATVHALVRTQGRTIAIPGECVTQAVEAPPELMQVPRRAGAIAGVMTVGRSVVPVISLARWLEPAADADRAASAAIERTHGLVMLLRSGGTCIGLAIEAVIGTQRIRPDQVRRLFHDDDPDELFQSAALFGNDSVATSILEPGRLMALAGVWVSDAGIETDGAGDTQEAAAAAARAERAAQDRHAVAWAAFRVADAHVALPAAHIGELLRLPPLRKELLMHDGVIGLCEWRDRLVPVVDLAGALHALPSGDAATWVCIVCEGELAIGLVMHEVLEIARIAPDAGTPEHAAADERSVVARRLVMGGRTLQLLDVAALMGRYMETAISAKGARAAQLRTTSDPGAPAYMVFDAGGMFAAQIDGVQEVVVLPEELRARLDAGSPATVQWREQPVPVVAIGDELISLPAQAARQLVIVRRNERLAALAIVGVKAMVPRGIAHRNRIRMQGRPVEVISVETEDHRASYPVVDLS